MRSATRLFALFAGFSLACVVVESVKQDADTNACLQSGSVVVERCKTSGMGYSSGCCKEIKEFNERGCFCNTVISYVFEDDLPNLQTAVSSCGYSLISETQCNIPNGRCGVPQYVIDRARLDTEVSIFEIFTNYTMPLDEMLATYGGYYVSDSELEIYGTGVYKGPDDIAEYIVIINPQVNKGLLKITNYTANAYQTIGADSTFVYLDLKICWYNDLMCTTETMQQTSRYIDDCNTDTFQEQFVRFSEDALLYFGMGTVNFGGYGWLCQRIQDACTGEYKQFESTEECLNFMNQEIPLFSRKCRDKLLQGNSAACRELHVNLAEQSPDPHCVHVGRGGYDSQGHYKCNDKSDCEVDDDDDDKVILSAVFVVSIVVLLTSGICMRTLADAYQRRTSKKRYGVEPQHEDGVELTSELTSDTT